MATNLVYTKFGGNSYGVCRGLDQGGKFKNKALIQKIKVNLLKTCNSNAQYMDTFL